MMHKVLATAADWGALRVWLGVNQKNQRAQRFYAKTGFKINGTGRFDWEPITRMTTPWFASLYDPAVRASRCGPQAFFR